MHLSFEHPLLDFEPVVILHFGRVEVSQSLQLTYLRLFLSRRYLGLASSGLAEESFGPLVRALAQKLSEVFRRIFLPQQGGIVAGG